MKSKKIKGWKVFDENLKCRDFQFEVGKTYTHKGTVELCSSGFHFHEVATDLFEYYSFVDTNRVCKVECQNVITGDDKSVCSVIKIVNELTWTEVLTIVNTGKNNTGRKNTGNWNTGDRNTGDRNTGDMNTGNRNTGDRNTGNWNTGNRNTGNWNTGNWNTANYSAGIFNTIELPTPIFNGAATVLMSEFKNTPNYKALFSSRFPLTEWISESEMTDQEKIDNPKFHYQKGYLKKRSYKEACEIWWSEMSKENKKLIQDIPGFSKEIFEEVTGIKL